MRGGVGGGVAREGGAMVREGEAMVREGGAMVIFLHRTPPEFHTTSLLPIPISLLPIPISLLHIPTHTIFFPRTSVAVCPSMTEHEHQWIPDIPNLLATSSWSGSFNPSQKDRRIIGQKATSSCCKMGLRVLAVNKHTGMGRRQ